MLGSLCGIKNVSQIHQWAEHDRTREFLRENFLIERVPCYYWLLSLLKMVKPESLNQCLTHWAAGKMPENREGLTLALDGKTVRSTEKMKKYQNPLHIVSAQLSELGLTLRKERKNLCRIGVIHTEFETNTGKIPSDIAISPAVR